MGKSCVKANRSYIQRVRVRRHPVTIQDQDMHLGRIMYCIDLWYTNSSLHQMTMTLLRRSFPSKDSKDVRRYRYYTQNVGEREMGLLADEKHIDRAEIEIIIEGKGS